MSLLLLAIAGACPSVPAYAQSSCFDYSQLPQLESRVPLAGLTRGLARRGDYVYVTAHTAGLHTVYVGDPLQPSLVSTFDSPGEANDVAFMADLAVLADGSRGLAVLSTSHSAVPVVIGELDPVPHLVRVAVAGSYACFAAADGATGLVIVDLSVPTNPAVVGTGPTSSSAVDIAVIGAHAFVVDTNRRLSSFDISNPSSPVLESTYQLTAVPTSLASRGTCLYVGCASGGIRVVDVSVPSAPVLAGAFGSWEIGYNVGTQIIDVVVEGERGCYVNGAGQLGIFDCSDADHPRLLTGIRLADAPSAVAVGGDLMFASLDDQGVQVLEDNGFALPAPVSALSEGADFAPGRFSLWADHAFVLSDSLRVLDMSAPGGPARVASIAVNGGADIDIQNGFAYVICTDQRLQVFDLAEPTAPVLASSQNTPGAPDLRSVQAAGNYLYTGPHNGRLRVWDISVPGAPIYLSTTSAVVDLYGLAVVGDRLYAGSGPQLQVFDISNPAAPLLLGTKSQGGKVLDIVVAGDRAYLAIEHGGLAIVDISDPGLQTLGDCPLPAARDISLVGNLAYVYDAALGVAVVDISDETQPTLIGVKRGRAYAGDIIGEHLLVSGTGALTAMELLPLHCDGISSVRSPIATVVDLRLRASPDPFNPQTQLRFSLDASAAVDLVVHDVAGRRVRQLLVREFREAGDHVVTWDGRDDRGRRLASGKYYCRLIAGAEAALRSVVLLK